MESACDVSVVVVSPACFKLPVTNVNQFGVWKWGDDFQEVFTSAFLCEVFPAVAVHTAHTGASAIQDGDGTP